MSMLDASHFRRLGDALGGVIFLCTDSTYASCVTQGLFGLPRPHSSYVQHIKPGMILFLFNTSTRRLHGIFEAVSAGGLDLDPAAWPIEGSRHGSRYPAQVCSHRLSSGYVSAQSCICCLWLLHIPSYRAGLFKPDLLLAVHKPGSLKSDCGCKLCFSRKGSWFN